MFSSVSGRLFLSTTAGRSAGNIGAAAAAYANHSNLNRETPIHVNKSLNDALQHIPMVHKVQQISDPGQSKSYNFDIISGSNTRRYSSSPFAFGFPVSVSKSRDLKSSGLPFFESSKFDSKVVFNLKNSLRLSTNSFDKNEAKVAEEKDTVTLSSRSAEEIFQFIDKQMNAGWKPSVRHLHWLLSKCASAQDIKLSVLALNNFKSAFIPIKTQTTKYFVEACVAAGTPDSALVALKSPEKLGLPLNVRAFDYLMVAYARNRDFTKVQETFKSFMKSISSSIVENVSDGEAETTASRVPYKIGHTYLRAALDAKEIDLAVNFLEENPRLKNRACLNRLCVAAFEADPPRIEIAKESISQVKKPSGATFRFMAEVNLREGKIEEAIQDLLKLGTSDDNEDDVKKIHKLPGWPSKELATQLVSSLDKDCDKKVIDSLKSLFETVNNDPELLGSENIKKLEEL